MSKLFSIYQQDTRVRFDNIMCSGCDSVATTSGIVYFTGEDKPAGVNRFVLVTPIVCQFCHRTIKEVSQPFFRVEPDVSPTTAGFDRLICERIQDRLKLSEDAHLATLAADLAFAAFVHDTTYIVSIIAQIYQPDQIWSREALRAWLEQSADADGQAQTSETSEAGHGA
ncbi:MAG: hypothetical protein IPO08_23710 [Xanthomonadales bacterium]|nr:hypothetical protein [Xanthomonadales bacterium]